MQTLFVLITIYVSYVNGQSTACYDYLSNSDCYDTNITSTSIYCWGFRSCFSSKLEATTGSVHCGGAYGCYYSEGIESISGSVYCDGDYGCANSNGEIEAWSANVYCDGNSGCYNVQADIQANNVYCTGDYGCYSTDGNITAKDYLYCDGNYGCYGVTGTLSATDVYVRGYNGARLTTIESKEDVTCSGSYSCYSSVIDSGGKTYFSGNYAGYYATVNAQHIECSGKYACYRSLLSVPGGTVDVYGNGAAYYSTMTVKDLNVYSYYGVYYSDITSPEGSSLTIQLYGYYSGYLMDVYCLATSSCSIKCYDNRACYLTKVYYYGDLSAISIYPSDCIDNSGTTNDDSVYCPTLISSTSTSLEEFQKNSKIEREKIKKFEKEIAEDLHRMEARKKRDDAERAKHEDTMVDNMYFNVEGVVSNVGVKKLNQSIYGSIIGGLLTFILLYCYYSNKNKGLKYETLS